MPVFLFNHLEPFPLPLNHGHSTSDGVSLEFLFEIGADLEIERSSLLGLGLIKVVLDLLARGQLLYQREWSGSDGQWSRDRGLFSRQITQRQPHVVNMDGARG